MKSTTKVPAPRPAPFRDSAGEIVMVDGLPFTPGMLEAFKNYTPSADVKPASKEQLLAMLANK